jgi:monoterpene epsilon-lactone hydrolase
MTELTVSTDPQGNLHLGPRVIPVPTSISENARKFLGTPFPSPPQPAITDKEGWKKVIAAANQMFEGAVDHWLTTLPATVETRTIAGVTVHRATPHALKHPERAHFRIHGGAWVFLGGRYAKGEAAMTAAEFGCVTFGLDYRMPPDDPYPAAVDDGLAVWRELIKQYNPRKIAISGASAGGNLSAAVTLRVRDAGLPMPACVGLLTPATDLTRASDTIQTNAGIDTVLRPGGNVIDLYANGHDLTNPYISPLYGDFAKGFPPTFLQSGTRDLLLSDTVRMHRALLRAHVPAELHVWEAMPHGGFGGIFGSPTPEDQEMSDALVAFVDRILG